jgi:hypothetical protein
MKDKYLDQTKFTLFLGDRKVMENVFATLNLLTNYPDPSDNQLSAGELTDIFETQTIMGRV